MRLKDKELIQVKRGLYLSGDAESYSLKAISGILYGPSYVSFETALSYYGLIPEGVRTVTCAAYAKNKNKVFNTKGMNCMLSFEVSYLFDLDKYRLDFTELYHKQYT
jgi:predicted transcriptional regulator of viral defense system